MKITRKGQKSVITIEEEISTIPIENIITSNSIQISEPLVLFKISTNKVRTTTIGNNIQIEPVIEKHDGLFWSITKQTNIDAYLDGKINSDDLLSYHFNKDTSHLLLLDEDQVQKAEQARMVTMDEFEVGPLNIPYVDTSKTVSIKHIENNVKLRLCEAHQTEYDYALRTSNENFLTRPIFVSTDSEHFNLEAVVEKLKDSPNFIFIDESSRNKEDHKAIPNNEVTLEKTIKRVPYYNQNSEGNLNEIKGYYIPTKEEIERIIQNDKKTSGYRWSYESYTGNDIDFKKSIVYGRDNIIAYSLGAISAHIEFSKMRLDSNKKHNNI